MNNMEYFLDDIESCEIVGQFDNEYVYDIEVDDETHTFIGNDILIHNSIYLSFETIMRSLGFKDKEKGIQFILHLNHVFIKHLFNDYLVEYANRFKVKNLHDFELETINRAGLHLEKKRYINSVLWEDGVFHEQNSYFIIKGVELIKSSTPLFVREKAMEIVKYLFKNADNPNTNDIIKMIKQIRKEFELAPIEEISMTTSCTNYKDKVLNDTTGFEPVKGAHFGVKAAAFHNYLLNKNSEYKSKYDLIKGGKVKYYYCNHPLNEVFAYQRSFHPIEIVEKEKVIIDYDTQFEKTVLTLVNSLIEPMGLPLINKRLSVLNSLFNF